MNTNRNNRRRGRGNRQQGGNGAQLNRIDSRARGNAPQMLDKYKKLAQDAQHHGDRVQMEYYLQFADHYFRVIADNKARQDEQRGGNNGAQRRNDERDQTDDFEDDFDFGRRSDTPTRSPYEQPETAQRSEVTEGEPGQEGDSFLGDDRNQDMRNQDTRSDDQGRERGPRRQPQRKPRDNRADGERSEKRADRPARTERNEGGERADRPERAERPDRAVRGERPARAERPVPAERPVTAERSETTERADKPARTRRPRKSADDGEARGIDSSILPPSIRGDVGGPNTNDGDSSALETVE